MDIIATLKKGTRHHRAGNLEAAMALYDMVLQNDPQHADTLHLYGLALHQQGNSDEAIRRINMAIANQPGNIVYHQNLCTIFSATGRIDEGIAICEAFGRQVPRS